MNLFAIVRHQLVTASYNNYDIIGIFDSQSEAQAIAEACARIDQGGLYELLPYTLNTPLVVEPPRHGFQAEVQIVEPLATIQHKDLPQTIAQKLKQ